jgi:hypothetical protein
MLKNRVRLEVKQAWQRLRPRIEPLVERVRLAFRRGRT